MLLIIEEMIFLSDLMLMSKLFLVFKHGIFLAGVHITLHIYWVHALDGNNNMHLQLRAIVSGRHVSCLCFIIVVV